MCKLPHLLGYLRRRAAAIAAAPATMIDHPPERHHLIMMTSLQAEALVAAEAQEDRLLTVPTVTATASEVGSMPTLENDAPLPTTVGVTMTIPGKRLMTCSGQPLRNLERQILLGRLTTKQTYTSIVTLIGWPSRRCQMMRLGKGDGSLSLRPTLHPSTYLTTMC